MSPNYIADDAGASKVDRKARAREFDTFVQSAEWMPSLESEELRMQFIDTMLPEEFVDWLKTINGVLVGENSEPSPLSERVSYVAIRNMAGVDTGTEVTTAPEDRQDLLGYALKAAQEAEDIESKAMILGFGINAVHPFADGNGRTARAVYSLLTNDYTPSNPRLVDAVSERGTKDMVLAPSIFGNAINQYLAEEMHATITVEGKIVPHVVVRAHNPDFQDAEGFTTPRRDYDADEVETMTNIFSNNAVGPVIAHILDLTVTSRSVRTALKENGPRQKVFYADQFLTNASAEEVEKAYDVFRRVTLERTKILIDALSGRNYSDVLVVGRSKRSEAYTFREFGKRAANGAMLSGIELS